MSRPAAPRGAPMLDDRYELVRRLGAGGMAEVLEARDHRLGRSVAIKRLRADLADPHARERFRREALTAAALTHPNVVGVYDVGEARGAPYIVMELVDGESLATRLAADGALDPADAVDVTEQLLGALGAAHALGLVHRDVKPANVLLAHDGTVKLADFGIAQALAGASSLTQTGQVVGTPRYLSPEQTMGAPASPQSDLYATGLVLYEMLIGAPPFTADSPAALAAAHQQAPVPRMRDHLPGIPSAVARTLERALAKDPAARFESAAAMADALRPGADATLADVSARTAVLPTVDDAGPTARAHGRGAVLATSVGLAMAAAALALLASAGDDRAPSQAATTTSTVAPAPVVSTPPTAPPTTLPPTTLPPQTVADLIALLANDPEGYGPAGPDLLERLEKIEEDPERAGHESSKTLDRLEHWVDRDQISPELAALTAQILTPLADTDDRGKGFGPGGMLPGDLDGEDDADD